MLNEAGNGGHLGHRQLRHRKVCVFDSKEGRELSYESNDELEPTATAGMGEQDRQEDDAVYEGKRRRSPLDLILVLAAVVLLAGIAVGVYFVLQAAKPGQQPQTMEDAQIQQIQAAIKQNPKAQGLYLQLAAGYFKVKDYDKANQALATLQSTNPTGTVLAESVYAQAKIAEMRGDSQTALTGYQRSLGITATPEATWALGSLCMDRKQYPDAVKNLEKYTSLMPTDADGYVKLGTAYEAAGDKTKALAAYKRATSFVPNNAAALAAINRLKGQ